MKRSPTPPQIIVLAGTNGAGKSSIAGEVVRRAGAQYFNPDEAARRIRARHPELSPEEASSRAWHLGRRMLEKAIEQRLQFAFETTLGGHTMTRLLMKAADAGIAVRIWYVGLSSADLHVERVHSRVARGGHDIPERRIRQRFDSSRENLIALLPHAAELRLLDNSHEGDPVAGGLPEPLEVLHWRRGELISACPLGDVPDWAKPIVQAALPRLEGLS